MLLDKMKEDMSSSELAFEMCLKDLVMIQEHFSNPDLNVNKVGLYFFEANIKSIEDQDCKDFLMACIEIARSSK